MILRLLYVVLQVMCKSLEPNMQFSLKMDSEDPDSSINCGHYN